MLDHLFGSKTRVKLLHLFLSNPESRFFVRELTRKLHQRINSVRRELDNLASIGLLQASSEHNKKYYQVNRSFPLYPELKNLMLKSYLSVDKTFTKRLRSIGKISYLTLTGFFTGANNVKTDVLIVGTVNRQKLQNLISQMQREFSHMIRYTVMTRKEFMYRNDLTDKFLYDILEQRRIVLIDTLRDEV